tara:strand:+ start:622 stop:897 length:276 start_codon:yes stop_codon:yes gene_type:complete
MRETETGSKSNGDGRNNAGIHKKHPNDRNNLQLILAFLGPTIGLWFALSSMPRNSSSEMLFFIMTLVTLGIWLVIAFLLLHFRFKKPKNEE